MNVLKATFPLQATQFKIKLSFIERSFVLNWALYFENMLVPLKVVLSKVTYRRKNNLTFLLSYLQL